MAENSTVKEHQCDERRDDIYNNIKELRTDIDKMKGGISVLKFIIPGMIVLLGAWVTLLFMWIKSEDSHAKRSAQADTMQWSEERGVLSPITEETLPPMTKSE